MVELKKVLAAKQHATVAPDQFLQNASIHHDSLITTRESTLDPKSTTPRDTIRGSFSITE